MQLKSGVTGGNEGRREGRSSNSESPFKEVCALFPTELLASLSTSLIFICHAKE
jgi:hypothetical protein